MTLFLFVAEKLFGVLAGHVLASPQRVKRYSRLMMLALLASSVAFVLLMWGQSQTQSTPLWQAFGDEPTAWVGLILVIVSTISFLSLFWQPPGIYHILFGSGLLMVGLVGWGLRHTQHAGAGLGQYLALGLSALFSLLAFVLISWDAVPLTSPLARVVYFRRYAHLKNVEQIARHYKCATVGPIGETHAFVAQGQWQVRELVIESSMQIGIGSFSRPHYLQIGLSSRKRLWPFTLKAGSLKLKRTALLRATRGIPSTASDGLSWRYPVKQVLKLTNSQREAIVQSPAPGINDEFVLRHFQSILDDIAKNLPSRTIIHTIRNQIFFEHTSQKVIPEDASAIEAWIASLDKILTFMETSGFTS